MVHLVDNAGRHLFDGGRLHAVVSVDCDPSPSYATDGNAKPLAGSSVFVHADHGAYADARARE